MRAHSCEYSYVKRFSSQQGILSSPQRKIFFYLKNNQFSYFCSMMGWSFVVLRFNIMRAITEYKRNDKCQAINKDLAHMWKIFHPLNIKHASHQIKKNFPSAIFICSLGRFICRNLSLFIVCNNGQKFIKCHLWIFF